MKMLLELIITFAKIGLLSFGGGYVAIPLVQQQVVEVKGWMTLSEFSDIVAIDELTPGPVAINAATFVGTRMAGVPGAIAATFGCVLPCCIIALIMAKLYYRYRKLKTVEGALSGLRAMVVGLIASTALSMCLGSMFKAGILSLASLDWLNSALLIIALVLFRVFKKKLNPVVILLFCGLLSLIVMSLLD